MYGRITFTYMVYRLYSPISEAPMLLVLEKRCASNPGQQILLASALHAFNVPCLCKIWLWDVKETFWGSERFSRWSHWEIPRVNLIIKIVYRFIIINIITYHFSNYVCKITKLIITCRRLYSVCIKTMFPRTSKVSASV